MKNEIQKIIEDTIKKRGSITDKSLSFAIRANIMGYLSSNYLIVNIINDQLIGGCHIIALFSKE